MYEKKSLAVKSAGCFAFSGGCDTKEMYGMSLDYRIKRTTLQEGMFAAEGLHRTHQRHAICVPAAGLTVFLVGALGAVDDIFC